MAVLAVPIGDHLVEKLWGRVRERSVRAESGCLEWQRAVLPHGYGKIKVNDHGKQRSFYPHRIAYVATYGEPEPHLTIDHLCGNRRCVEPAHLEAVTFKENVLRGNGPTARHARKTHCSRGHEFTDENTGLQKTSAGWGRYCKICDEMKRKQAYSKKRIARALQVLEEEGYALP